MRPAMPPGRQGTCRATPAPDGGLRQRAAQAQIQNSLMNGSGEALHGAESFVAQMVQDIHEESKNQANRGGQKCKMAVMTHHSRDKLWTEKASSGLSRKDYTVQELKRGLSQLGFGDAQVNECVQRAPDGLGTVHHYTASLDWGPLAAATATEEAATAASFSQLWAAASPSGSTGPQRRPSSAPAARPSAVRPSSAPTAGRGSVERPAMPHDLLLMGRKLSDAEQALSEVRAGLSSQMAVGAGGAQPSAPKPQVPKQARPASASGSQQAHVVAPGRIRPSSAPGSRYNDVKYEAAVNHCFSQSSHVPIPKKNPKLPQRSKSKRPSSAPAAHSAARARARARTKEHPDIGVPIAQTQAANPASMVRSYSWATLRSAKPAAKPLPSSFLSGQDCWSHSTARPARRQRRQSKGKGRPKSTGNPATFTGLSHPPPAQCVACTTSGEGGEW